MMKFRGLFLAAILMIVPSYALAAPGDVAEYNYVQRVSNIISQYPAQSGDFLTNYLGINTNNINMAQFNRVVASGNQQSIYDHTMELYYHRDEINHGTYSYDHFFNNYYGLGPTPAAYAPRVADDSIMGLTPTGFYAATGGLIAGGIFAATFIGDGGGGNGIVDGPIYSGADFYGRTDIADSATPASFLTAEFSSYPLNAIGVEKANYAYAKGLNGTGVKVGIFDYFNSTSGTATEYSANVVGTDLVASGDDCDVAGDTAPCTHGETVANRLAATKNDVGIHGIAYNASLLLSSLTKTGGWSYLLTNGAKVINVSLGCDPSSCTTSNINAVNAEYGPYMLAAQSADVVVVIASGNEGPGHGGETEPATPANFASTYPYTIIVASAVEANLTNDYANPCGAQKQYCMVAISADGTSFSAPQIAGAAALIRQGWPFLTSQQTSKILLSSATDIGAAGVDDAFGHGLLNIQAAVNPIGPTIAIASLGNAINYQPSGITQNQGTAFGNAFTAANKAHGNVTIVDSFGRDFAVRADDHTHVVNNPTLSPERIRSLGAKKPEMETMKLGDNFSMQFGESVDYKNNKNVTSLAEYKVSDSMKYKLGFSSGVDNLTTNELQKFNKSSFISANAFDNSFLKFSDNNQVFSNQIEYAVTDKFTTRFSNIFSRNNYTDDFHTMDDQVTSDYSSNMFEAIYSPSQALSFNFKNGYTHEPDSLLGSRFYGSFDVAHGSNTYFSGLDLSYDVSDNWNFFASYNIGVTKATAAANSSFNNISDILSDSFALTLTRNEVLGDDQLSFSVAQPTRVISGNASGLTQSVDPNSGAVSITGFSQSLTPTGRTMLYQTAYGKEVNEKVDVNLAVEYADQPDHDESQAADKSIVGKVHYKLN